MTATTTTTTSDMDKSENASSPSYGIIEGDNTLNTGNIIDFLNEREISWQPMKIVWKVDKNGKKVKVPTRIGKDKYMPKTNDFYGDDKLSETELKKRQKSYLKYDFIAIDTSNVSQIDIDDVNITDDLKMEYINGNPYFLSMGKELPHIFITVLDGNDKVIQKNIDGNNNEILTKQWSWAKRDAIVYNYSNPIKNFDLQKYKKTEIKESMCLVTNVEPTAKKCLVDLTPDVGKLADKMKKLKLGDKISGDTISGDTISGDTNSGDTETLPGFSDLVADVARVLEIMDAKKRSNYQDWLNVGLALFNSKLDVDLWVNFSKRMDNFDEQECLVKWDSFKAKTGGLTIGSLRYWAKEDNLEEYRIFRKNEILNSKDPITIAVKKARNGNDFDVANVVYSVCKGKYTVCVEDKTKSALWFKYMKHRWVGNGAMFILEDMSSIVVFHITKVIIMYDDLISLFPEDKEDKKQESDEEKELREEKNGYETVTLKLLKVVNNLKTTSKKRAYLKELECPCYFGTSYKEFHDKLDTNKFLMGFNNGIYDLEKHIFRDGTPEDMISLSTGYDYTNIVNVEIRAQLYKLIFSFFEDKEEQQGFLNYLSYALIGELFLQIYMNWIGEGANGKSLAKGLCSYAFGDYFKEIDISQLVDNQRHRKDGANSELAQCRGRRLVMTAEPQKDDKISCKAIKTWTGEDAIQARELYGQMMTFIPQFVLFVLTNHPIQFTHIDKAITRRIVVQKFPFTFKDTPDIDIEDERQKDDTLGATLKNPEYIQQFMLILLENLKVIGRDIKPTTKMLEATKEYIDETNPVVIWLKENYEFTGNKKEKISSTDLRNDYNNDNSENQLNAKVFTNMLGANGIKFKRSNRGMDLVGYKKKDNKCRIVTTSDNDADDSDDENSV